MKDNYVVYHLHSDLSNGVTSIDSVTKPDQYIEKAKECGMQALAFSEHGSVFSWIKKKEHIEAADMKYIHAEEFYVTTKLWINDFGEGKSLKEVDEMLKRLQTDYIDLLLLHWPKGDYIGAYKDMEKAFKQGKVRSIGLSNFTVEHIEKIMKMCTVKPAINQLELHPYAQRREIVKLCDKYNIKVEAWYPIGHGDKNLLENPVFTKISKKYKKTNAQVILRWHIQKGYIIFPRSRNPIHIKENIDIFDFELSKEEIQEIDNLDKKKLYINW